MKGGFVTFVIAFSADGDWVAIGATGGAVHAWDLRHRLSSPNLALAELQTLWGQLGGGDAKKAYEAMRTLSAAAGSAEPFLADQLAQAKNELQALRAIEALENLATPAARPGSPAVAATSTGSAPTRKAAISCRPSSMD